MKKNVLIALPLVVFAFLFASCDKVPQVEIDAAKAAVEEAKSAGADIYLSSELSVVEDSLNAVIAGIEGKKSKLFAKYKVERTALSGISAMALEVKTNTIQKIEEIKAEVTATIADARTLIAEDKALVEKAPKGKGGAAVLEEIKNDISVIETAVEEAQGLLDNAKLLDAKAKADAVKAQAAGIKSELEEAIAKTKKK